MLQVADRVGFAVEALAGFRVTHQVRGEHLEGNQAVQARVAAFVHFPHPARSELREDFIRPKKRAGLEGHKPLIGAAPARKRWFFRIRIYPPRGDAPLAIK